MEEVNRQDNVRMKKTSLSTYVEEKMDRHHSGKEGTMRMLDGGEGGGAMILSRWGWRHGGSFMVEFDGAE